MPPSPTRCPRRGTLAARARFLNEAVGCGRARFQRCWGSGAKPRGLGGARAEARRSLLMQPASLVQAVAHRRPQEAPAAATGRADLSLDFDYRLERPLPARQALQARGRRTRGALRRTAARTWRACARRSALSRPRRRSRKCWSRGPRTMAAPPVRPLTHVRPVAARGRRVSRRLPAAPRKRAPLRSGPLSGVRAPPRVRAGLRVQVGRRRRRMRRPRRCSASAAARSTSASRRRGGSEHASQQSPPVMRFSPSAPFRTSGRFGVALPGACLHARMLAVRLSPGSASSTAPRRPAAPAAVAAGS
jgi:hypothetical protein